MQTPKSILLHLDSSARTAERVKAARRLADDFEAEVIGQPCLLTALVRYPFAMEGAVAAMALMQEQDKDALARIHSSFLQAAGGSTRLQWAEPLAQGPWGFARRSLYADLMVLGQRNAADPAAVELPSDFLPSVLIESARPALILPYAGTFGSIGQSVLVAWKETREAARAVSAALPWLQRANEVHVVSYGEDAGMSLDSLQRYLKAQGVSATSHNGGPEQGDAGNHLLSMATDVGADLLVMGCYGHGRAREWVMGGVTRTVLGSMTLPVLMSH